MDNFDYENMLRFCFAYHSVGLQEHRIISFLTKTDKFIGTASHLSRQLDILPSNGLKGLNRLENAGIIYVEKDKTRHMVWCKLVDNWMEILVERAESGVVLHAQQKPVQEIPKVTIAQEYSALREEGKSYQQIADMYGVSRQSVHGLLKRYNEHKAEETEQ